MAAIFVLLLAAFSRLVPHLMHGAGLNFTAVGGGLLYFGARSTGSRGLRLPAAFAALLGMLVMAATDVYLTTSVYGVSFHVVDYLVTWAWYAGVCLMGAGLLRNATAGRAALAVLGSATSFFMISNFMVWAAGGMYPHTAAGLGACFGAALPFYGNDLASTALTVGALFGLPVLASRMQQAFRSAPRQSTPPARQRCADTCRRRPRP